MEKREIFFKELQHIIKENSSLKQKITNPDNIETWDGCSLSQLDVNILKSLNLTQDQIEVFEKLTKDAVLESFYQCFCLIDGVTDPVTLEDIETEVEWDGLSLVDPDEEDEPLHDSFYSSYMDSLEE